MALRNRLQQLHQKSFLLPSSSVFAPRCHSLGQLSQQIPQPQCGVLIILLVQHLGHLPTHGQEAIIQQFPVAL